MHGRCAVNIVRLKGCAGFSAAGTFAAASRRLHICSASSLPGAHQQHQQQRQVRLLASTEAHTQRLAQLLAADTRQGDCICLHGAVGSGKSFFSREFVRTAYDDPGLPVPSPTYLLQNIYDDLEGPPIHHFDLYRLNGALDLQRIGWTQSLQAAVCLVEWPDVLGDHLPEQRLNIRISVAAQGAASDQQTAADHAQVTEQEPGSEFEDVEPRLIGLEFSSSWSARVAGVMRSLQDDPELTWRQLPA